MDVAGKKVLVVGMARSGVAAATLAHRVGAVVTCVDLRPDAPRVPGTTAQYGPHDRGGAGCPRPAKSRAGIARS